MAINIIQRGNKENLRKYHTIHCDCGTIFECEPSDGKLQGDQRDGDFVFIDCPVCHDSKIISLRLFKPLPANARRPAVIASAPVGEVTCKGSIALATGCMECSKCLQEMRDVFQPYAAMRGELARLVSTAPGQTRKR